MKTIIRNFCKLTTMFGFDPLKMLCSLIGIPFYLNDFVKLRHQRKTATVKFPFGKPVPCLGERFSESELASGQYFHQDLLVARKLFLSNPEKHVDIGSRVDGFVAHVASFRPIEVLDIRPLSANIKNITFTQVDMMSPVKDSLVDYCDSLSSLHAIEHFGLGRYGDAVNYEGYINGLENFSRILQKNGKFYFSVPIGKMRIEFNAHRVFSVAYLLEYFEDKYTINSFSYIDDKGDLHENVTLTKNDIQNNFGCRYGCGVFEMTKT